MPAKDPAERSTLARIAAAERWGRAGSREARVAATAAARNGLRAKFLREVDPDGTLSDEERERGADHLMHAHMLKMALRARVNRRKARELVAAAQTVEAELSSLVEPAT